MKRILLFLATNLAILIVISIILSIFNIRPYLTQYGLDYQSLLIYAAIIGFTGSILSLMLSKWMAVHAFGVRVITKPSTEEEMWLLSYVKQLCMQMQIPMPEVGIYDSPEPNAFATGPSKNNALLAVSTGLLAGMNKDEVEGVLGHEVSHIANGDMVTLTLIQGVVNTFVIFFARIAAFAVTSLLRGEKNAGGAIYFLVAIVFEILFGILASMIVMWFSRQREYRADAGSAKYVGKEKMIEALQRLGQMMTKAPVDNRAPAFNAFKIAGHNRFFQLFSSHPPIEDRIKALEEKKY